MALTIIAGRHAKSSRDCGIRNSACCGNGVSQGFSEFRLIIYAVVLILSLLFMPDGTGGLAKKLASQGRVQERTRIGVGK